MMKVATAHIAVQLWCSRWYAYDFIDLPGYWAQPAEYLSDLRPAFETFNLLLTFEPAEGSWYDKLMATMLWTREFHITSLRRCSS